MRAQLRWLIPSILVSIAAVIGLQLAVERWPDLGTLYRIVPPLFALGLLALLYRNWIRRDRVAFLSVAVPAIALATASIVSEWPANTIFFWASLGLVVGVAWSDRVRGWWTVHVLRRPPLTPRRRFRGALRAASLDWSKALSRNGPLTPAERRHADSAIAYMRSLTAPDAELEAIRNDLADLAERWVVTPRTEEHVQAFVDLNDALGRVNERINASRAND